MPLIPLEIPPGIYRNGTEYQSAGRWRDASLVRWSEGVMRPVGGWSRRGTVDVAGAARGALAWRDLAGDRWLALGEHDSLKVMKASNILTDITPVGLTVGTVSATSNLAYGGGFYGSGTYGTPRADTGTYSEATTWSLDNFGEVLVACSNADGKLYQWTLNTAAKATAISGAPTSCLGLMVTDERFLFALGAGGNPRKVQWADRESLTVWTPLASNQAGDQELQTSGQIMLGIRSRGQAVILTDIDAHVATYLGPPFVYGFQPIGTACGVISRNGAAAVDAGVFWMGQSGFFRFSGGAAETVPCDVSDYIYGDINRQQMTKVYAVANAQNREIWWFYPSAGSTENDRYVAYNYAEGHWMIGSLARTCGVDAGVFRSPIMTDPAGFVYDHEIGPAVSGAAVFVESGPIQIGQGDQVMCALELIPDEKTQGDVVVTFKTRFHPNGLQRSYGPYVMANPVPVRFTGRQVSMRVTGSALTDWRFGTPRLDVTPGGRR